MGRPAGTRNPGYDERRAELATLVGRALMKPDGGAASFRQLAAAAGVSVPTLRHYFEDHDGAVVAGLDALRQLGQGHMDAARDPGELKLGDSMLIFLTAVARAWRSFGIGRTHATGLMLGLGHERRGPAYVSSILEPTIDCAEARLGVHQGRGELRDCDLRVAALALLAPAVLALLHQDELHGVACRPLDVDAFLAAHVDGFVRGYGG